MEAPKSPWNSLEIAKLIVSISLPITVVAFGFMTKDALLDREHKIRLSEKVLEKRQEIYEQVRVPLNNIYSYIEEVGSYKKMTPSTINDDRRKLHATMHTQRAYWSAHTFSAYLDYMDNVAFKTWQGVTKDAVIQDSPGQKKSLPSWKEHWEERFSGNQDPNHKRAYNKLINFIATDLGANVGS